MIDNFKIVIKHMNEKHISFFFITFIAIRGINYLLRGRSRSEAKNGIKILLKSS